MIRGLYTAVTNLKYNEQRLDSVSSNIANMSTYGFKKDDVCAESFNDVLIQKQNGSTYEGDGPVSGVNAVKQDDGQILADTTSGFFRVQTPEGISNNRTLKFGIDSQGYLSTIYYNTDKSIDTRYGNRVLDKSGNPVQVGTGAQLDVDKSGNLMVNGAVKANLVSSGSGSVIGALNAGVMTKRTITDFSQGNIITTESKNDFALTDSGFFVVNTPAGMAYTRNGAFKINSNMELVTNDGSHVQGLKGNIRLTSPDYQVNTFGEIISGGEIIDKIKTVDFTNKSELEKLGMTYFVLRDDSKQTPAQYKGKVVQASLEQSNADSVTEMVKMLTLFREYESGQKLVKAYDDTLSKAVNEVARF